MNPVMLIHIGAGVAALLCGAVAATARKGGRVHGGAGTGFAAAMLILGVTASILGPLKTPPDSPVGGIMVCYFVATGWMTARRRDGTPRLFEKIACAFILAIAALILAAGYQALSAPPGTIPSAGALFGIGGFCLLAGLLDLNFILRGRLTARQRLSRHLWRMCFAFFIATGSFFLGQQDVLPSAARGSPILFVLAFAPFAIMLFWLVRLGTTQAMARLKPARPFFPDPAPEGR